MKIVKNVFNTQGHSVISKPALEELIGMCTLDGSTVHRIKLNYVHLRAWGTDNKTIIWTKKEDKNEKDSVDNSKSN